MTEPRVSQNMPFLTRRPQNKIVSQGWRDSSAIKSTCCFCKRTWVQFHELTRHNCNSSSKGSDHLWPPQASAHTYIQANGHTYKYLKRKEIVAISLQLSFSLLRINPNQFFLKVVMTFYTFHQTPKVTRSPVSKEHPSLKPTDSLRDSATINRSYLRFQEDRQ